MAFWFRNTYWADEVAHQRRLISDDSHVSGLNNARALVGNYPGLEPFLREVVQEIAEGRPVTEMERALLG